MPGSENLIGFYFDAFKGCLSKERIMKFFEGCLNFAKPKHQIKFLLPGMKEKIEKVLNELRPMLQNHGGDVALVDFNPENGLVKVELRGGCLGCPMAETTLKQGIEKYLKEKIPEIKKVIAV